jgi:hypothetical protein
MFLKSAITASAGIGIAVALATANAAPLPHPGAKIIKVKQSIARQALRNTPDSEEGAASWRALPKVTFLRPPEKPLDPIRLLPGVKPLLDGLERLQ